MKKVLAILVFISALVLITYFSIQLYTNSKLDHVMAKLHENNPEITKINKINSIGHWGEWFSEYVILVEMDGEYYRIWTTENGEIMDKEPL